VADHTNGNLEDADMKDKNVEIVRMLKGGLSEGLEDKGTSD
jgi:hypothetical protein